MFLMLINEGEGGMCGGIGKCGKVKTFQSKPSGEKILLNYIKFWMCVVW